MKGTNELYVIEWEKHQKECNYTTHRQQISNYHHHHCCSAAGAGSSHNKQSPPSPTINHSSHSIHTINDQYNNELSDIIEFIDKHTKPNPPNNSSATTHTNSIDQRAILRRIYHSFRFVFGLGGFVFVSHGARSNGGTNRARVSDHATGPYRRVCGVVGGGRRVGHGVILVVVGP